MKSLGFAIVQIGNRAGAVTSHLITACGVALN